MCSTNGKIDLGVCNQDTLADRIIGFVSKWYFDKNLFIYLIIFIINLSYYCKT
jgi:hypothetical protein